MLDFFPTRNDWQRVAYAADRAAFAVCSKHWCCGEHMSQGEARAHMWAAMTAAGLPAVLARLVANSYAIGLIDRTRPVLGDKASGYTGFNRVRQLASEVALHGHRH